jgi:hypothetical protein
VSTQTKWSLGAGLILSTLLWCAPVEATSVAVRFVEGVARGFPVLRSTSGEMLARGDLRQVARGDRVESRLTFRFVDGSLYDETVVFSQRGAFTLLSYRLVQRGPSFPEAIEATLDRETQRYEVRYKADEDSPEEVLQGRFTIPEDAYNGMLTVLLKNLPAGASETVHIVAFTPRPRAVKLLLAPSGKERVLIGDAPLLASRYVIRPQLGPLASLLIVQPADITCWILGDDAPAFMKFEGPLYFMGPIWRIELH